MIRVRIEINVGLDADTLTAIYCYTMYSEAQYYRKWLEELIEIAK